MIALAGQRPDTLNHRPLNDHAGFGVQNMRTIIILGLGVAGIGHAVAQWTGTGNGLLPAGHSIISLDAVDADVVWAVGGNSEIFWNGLSVPAAHQPTVLRTTDGGATWDVFAVPGTMGRYPFTLVALSAQEMYFTAGTSGGQFNSCKLFFTVDGGANWQERTQAQMANGIGLFLYRFNADDWFAYRFGNGAISSDGGANWANAGVPPLDGGSIMLMSPVNTAARSGDQVWIGTSTGRILTSADKGATWSVQFSAFNPGRGIHTMAFHDAANGMAASCWNSAFADVPLQLIRTDDGGATWVPANAPAEVLGCIAAVPGVPGAYVGVMDGWMNSVSYRTVDNGDTWQQVDAGTPYMSVEFTSPEHGWAGAGHTSDHNGPAMYKWSGGPLGIAERPDGAIATVHPNPAKGPITVVAPGLEGAVQAQLCDARGSVVRAFGTITTADGRSRLDVGGLVPGLYLLELRGSNGVRMARVQVL